VAGQSIDVLLYISKSIYSISKETAKPAEPATPPDYPRPKEEEGVEHDEQAQHQQEEQAKREKNKRAEFSPEHVVKRDSKWTDGAPRKNQAHGGAGRISQPAGKAFPS
jgi:hypothetical protein